MARLYYDDPLYAAIAARDFGVKYYTFPDKDDIDSPTTWENEFSRFDIDASSRNVTYYIHPDSHHIFEPQEGDLINGWADRIGEVCLSDEDVVTIDVHGGDWECPKEFNGKKMVYEIIQRNGKLFPCPKREDCRP